jgi:hypothetical protein
MKTFRFTHRRIKIARDSIVFQSCGALLSAERTFLHVCGALLSVERTFSHVCGALLSVERTFLHVCGALLSTAFNLPLGMIAVRAIPQSFLIDPQGIIIAQDLRGEALKKKLEEIFGK